MTKAFIFATAALALAGCASSGGSAGRTDGANGTSFSSPKAFSTTEFSTNPKGYAKDMVQVGSGLDSYKKVTIPACTVAFQKNMQTVNRSKLGVFLKGDGTKSDLTMNVGLPVDTYHQTLKEITATSCDRLKEKFKKAGAEIVDWAEVKAKFPTAVEFEQEKLATEPVAYTDTAAIYAGNGYARLNSIMWAHAASSLSRKSEIAILMPNFGVGYGYFQGEATPFTITEKHDMAEVQFTPQVQVLTGSGVAYQAKWDTGGIVLKNTLIANEPFVKKMNVMTDSRKVAKEDGEKARGVYMAATGAQAHETQMSSSAAINYELGLDEPKYKQAVLAELDKAENLIIERYKNEL